MKKELAALMLELKWVKEVRMKGLSRDSKGYKQEEYLYWSGYRDAIAFSVRKLGEAEGGTK